MDINMPTLGGLAAASTIRALVGPTMQDVPILAMTAEQGSEKVEDILHGGMNGHLAKPFGRKQLLEAIAPWIG